MGKKIKLFSRRVFAKLLQVLGISSLCTAFGCSLLNNKWAPVAMYGVPGNFFTLEGTVTDEDGNAINGIEINVKTKENAEVPENPSIETQTYTTETGTYSLTWHYMDKEELDWVLEIKDIDGNQNGSFEDTTDPITFTENDISGKTDFGNIKYKKENMQIKLSQK